jgi:hypothetical protein
MAPGGDKLSVFVEVELLCRAHYCFVLVCSMDVVDAVLNVAKERVPAYVAAGHFNPLVKLLCSIKQFREMEWVHPTSSRHVKPHHVTSRPLTSRHDPTRPVTSCPILSRHDTSRHVTSRHVASVTSHHARHITPCVVTPNARQLTPCYVTISRVAPPHTTTSSPHCNSSSGARLGFGL